MVDALNTSQKYPQSVTVVGELLMVHDEQFVVKVTIETPDLGTATAMAADAVIEAAEDRARQRALQGLSLVAEAKQMPAPPSDHQPSEKQQRQRPKVRAASQPVPSPTLEIAPPPLVEVPDAPEELASAPPAAPAAPLAETEPAFPETPDPPSTALPETALPAPVNLSDVIAQTDVELRRLGWSVAAGREHLEKAYGKRSRHDLTDEELLSFLLHLESLPTPQGMPP